MSEPSYTAYAHLAVKLIHLLLAVQADGSVYNIPFHAELKAAIAALCNYMDGVRDQGNQDELDGKQARDGVAPREDDLKPEDGEDFSSEECDEYV